MKYAPLLKPYSTAAREAVDYSIHMGGMGSADVYSENITLENGAYIQDNNILTLSATDKVVIKKETSQLPLPTLYVNGNGTQNVEAKTIEVTVDDTRPAFLVDYGGSGIFKASESATFTGDVVVYGGNLDFTTTAKTEIKGGGLAAYGASSSLKWTGAQDTEFVVTNRAHSLVDTNLAVADALTLWVVSADLSNVKTTLLASPEAEVYSSYDKSKGAAARLLRGGSVTLKNATVEGTVISNGENASGEKSAFNVASGGSFQMKGDVLAGNGGTVNLVLDSAKSKLEGYIDSASDWERANFANEARQYTDDLSETIATESAGAVNLTLANGGVWTVKDWSTFNELTLNEGGVVDLTEKLGTFLLSMGEDAAKSTMLYVEKASASSQNVEISLDNVSNVMDLNGRRFATTNGTTPEADALSRDATSSDLFTVTST